MTLSHTLDPNPYVTGGRFAAGNETTFTSEEAFTVHEHYLKVVSRSYEPLEARAVEFGVLSLECTVLGVGCRVWGAGCRVQGAGCKVRSVGCRV